MRPSEWLIWWAYPEELEKWLDNVLKGKTEGKANIVISDDEIEG